MGVSPRLALADGVDALLGGLQNVLAGVGALLNHGGQVAGGLSHPAQQGLVLENVDILPHIGRGGGDVHELEQIVPGVLLVVPVLLHVLQHGERVDGEGVVEHGVDGLIDLHVLLPVEVVRAQLVNDLRDTPGVDEHGAQHRLLRLVGVGQLLQQQLVFGWQGHHHFLGNAECRMQNAECL